MGHGSLKELVKTHGNAELEKGPSKPQGKQMSQGCLRENKWDKRAHKQCNTKPKWPHWVIESRISNRPKEAGVK